MRWLVATLKKRPTFDPETPWPTAIGAAVVTILVGFGIFYFTHSFSDRTGEPAVPSTPVVWTGRLASVVVADAESDHPIVHLLVSDAAAVSVPDSPAIAAPSRFEAIAEDPAFVRQVGKFLSAEENGGNGDLVTIRATTSSRRIATFAGERLDPAVPLVELASVAKDDGKVVAAVGDQEQEQNPDSTMTDAELRTIAELRSLKCRTVLAPQQCEILSAAPLHWRVRVANREFVVSFPSSKAASQAEQFRAGFVHLAAQPTGDSCECVVNSKTVRIAELQGELQELPAGTEVEWTGMLDKLLITPSATTPAVHLLVADSSGKHEPLFDAFTQNLSLGRELADFATAAEARGQGDLVVIKGKLGSSENVARALSAGTVLRRVEIASVIRTRDKATVSGGGKRSDSEMGLTGPQIVLAEKLRSQGSRVAFAATVQSVESSNPARVRVRVAELNRDYLVSFSGATPGVVPARKVRIAATATGKFSPCTIDGQVRDVAELQGVSIAPTYAEIQANPRDYQLESYQFPATYLSSPSSAGDRSIKVRLDEIDGAKELELPVNIDVATSRDLSQLKSGQEIDAEFTVAPANPMSSASSGASLVLNWISPRGQPGSKIEFLKKVEPSSTQPQSAVLPQFAVKAERPFITKPKVEIHAAQSGGASPGIAAAAPVGDLVVTCGFGPRMATAIWNLSGNAPVQYLSGAPPQISEASWSANSSFLLLQSNTITAGYPGNGQGSAMLWETGKSAWNRTFNDVKPGCDVAWSGDRVWMYGATTSGTIRGYRLNAQPINLNLSAAVHSLALSPDGSQLATLELDPSGNSGIGGGSAKLELVVRKLPNLGTVTTRFTIDGLDPQLNPPQLWWVRGTGSTPHRLVMRQARRVVVWDWNGSTVESPSPRSLEIPGDRIAHNEDWTRLVVAIGDRPAGPSYSAYGPGSMTAYRTSSSAGMAVYDLTTGLQTARLSCDGFLDFAMSPPGDRLAVLMSDGSVIVGDITKGFAADATFMADTPATSLSWRADGKRLVTCHADGVVRLWNPLPTAADASRDVVQIYDWAELVQQLYSYAANRHWAEYQKALAVLKGKNLPTSQKKQMLIAQSAAKARAEDLWREYKQLQKQGDFASLQIMAGTLAELVQCEANFQRLTEARNTLAKLPK